MSKREEYEEMCDFSDLYPNADEDEEEIEEELLDLLDKYE